MKKILCIFTLLSLIPTFAVAHTEPAVRVFPLPGTVTLVFDDGPDPATTFKILEVLGRYKVKANFNLIGYYAQNYPVLVKEIVKQGHVVGNHSLSHLDLTKVSTEALKSEIGKSKKILEQLTKKKVYCLEPPFMRTNYKVAQYQNNYNLRKMPAPVDSYDYMPISTKKFIDHVVDSAISGSLILLHDSRPRTIAALPVIIEGIRSKGLGFSVICVPETKK